MVRLVGFVDALLGLFDFSDVIDDLAREVHPHSKRNDCPEGDQQAFGGFVHAVSLALFVRREQLCLQVHAQRGVAIFRR